MMKLTAWVAKASDGAARRLGLDTRGLALFRIGLGLLVTLDVLMRSGDIEAFYTDFGILPVGPYVQEFANKLHVSLHLASGTLGWQAFLFALTFVAGAMLLFGYKTRLAVIACWILIVSVQNRNPMILNGGDVLFRILLFWGMFVPLGARWSVDAALAEPAPPRVDGPAQNRVFSAGTIGLTLQVVFIYFTTALLKNGKEWWPDGTASFFALSLDSFVTSFGIWMRQFPELLRWSTYGVWLLELVGPFLLFAPFFYVGVRLAVLAAFILLHVNFDLAMRLGLFPWVDIVLLVALIPGEAFDWLERRWRTEARLGLKIFYDYDCGFCRRMALLLREAFLIKETPVLAAQEDPAARELLLKEESWVVRDAAGVDHVRYDALVTLLEHAPIIGGAVRRLPLRALTPIGDRAYRLVARARGQLGAVAAALLPSGPAPRLTPSYAGNLLGLFFVGYIALWNVKTIPEAGIQMLPPWDKIGVVLRLDQKWNMFAPFPLKEDGWYVIAGELADGSSVEVLSGVRGEIDWEKPALVAYDKYKNARWRKYLMNIWSKKRRGHRLYYGRYLCRSWNREHDEPEAKLKRFEIFFLKEYSELPGIEQPITRHSIWQHDCFKKSS